MNPWLQEYCCYSFASSRLTLATPLGIVCLIVIGLPSFVRIDYLVQCLSVTRLNTILEVCLLPMIVKQSLHFCSVCGLRC